MYSFKDCCIWVCLSQKYLITNVNLQLNLCGQLWLHKLSGCHASDIRRFHFFSVEVLAGIRMQATESPSLVLEYYDKILRTDSTNAVGHT